jgi:hypothetical protein
MVPVRAPGLAREEEASNSRRDKVDWRKERRMIYQRMEMRSWLGD